MRETRWVPPLLVALLAGLFAYRNAGERITIDLGVATLYRVSLAGVVLTSFLLGMIAMFLLGLRHDLRVRRVLREQRLGSWPPRSYDDAPADSS